MATEPAAATNPLHVLAVTVERCTDCTQGQLCSYCLEDPELWHVIKCPGVTDACRAWEECDDCENVSDYESLAETSFAHGQEHRYLDGRWMTPTSDCYIATYEDLPDAIDYLDIDGAGRYEVSFDFTEANYLKLDLVRRLPD